MSREPEEYTVLEVAFKNGRRLEINICNCAECESQFFVPAPSGSGDWKPAFCPYCGIKFISCEIDDLNL